MAMVICRLYTEFCEERDREIERERELELELWLWRVSE